MLVEDCVADAALHPWHGEVRSLAELAQQTRTSEWGVNHDSVWRERGDDPFQVGDLVDGGVDDEVLERVVQLWVTVN